MSKLLVVEDDPQTWEFLDLLLNDEGYTVYHAADGEQAILLTRIHHPDLVIMDLGLPRLGGSEAAATLKDDAATRDIPIIATSVRYRANQPPAGLRADRFLSKPFDLDELLGSIATFLGPTSEPN